MSIRYKCAECGASMKIKDELSGTKGNCPKCKTEFVVPAPEAAEPVEAKAVEAKSAETKSSSREPDELVTEESLEDEYQRILMGDSPSDGGLRKRETDSDAFLSVDPSDDDPPANGRDSHSDHDIRTDRTAPKPPSRTTAEISASLMKNTSEPTLKKSGKAFGEGSSDKDAARKKLAAETRVYYTRQIGLLAIVVVIVGGGLYWLSSMMMGGPKYPPLGRVYGKVTMDGKPLAAALVTFQPIVDGPQGNVNIGASVGRTDTAGLYELYYVEGVRGAVIGKHFIQVRAPNEAGLEAVPDKFNANSQLGYEVKSSSQEHNIELTKN